jgi:hypothetical protein
MIPFQVVLQSGAPIHEQVASLLGRR